MNDNLRVRYYDVRGRDDVGLGKTGGQGKENEAGDRRKEKEG